MYDRFYTLLEDRTDLNVPLQMKLHKKITE